MEFSVYNRKLKYEENGDIYLWCDGGKYKKNPKWKLVSIKINSCGYKKFNIGNNQCLIHRIIGMLFLGLNFNDSKQIIDHIDGNKQNNDLKNLRIVNVQQNAFNRIKAKGYCFHKRDNKYQANIKKDGKSIHLGYYDTEEEARQAYLDAKQIYHKIT